MFTAFVACIFRRAICFAIKTRKNSILSIFPNRRCNVIFKALNVVPSISIFSHFRSLAAENAVWDRKRSGKKWLIKFYHPIISLVEFSSLFGLSTAKIRRRCRERVYIWCGEKRKEINIFFLLFFHENDFNDFSICMRCLEKNWLVYVTQLSLVALVPA